MTEEIKTQQTAAAASRSAFVSVEETTASARKGAERENGDGKTGNHNPPVSWASLLEEAVTKPGFIHEAYSRFHGFSIGNQILALVQCHKRGIQPGPLASFNAWKRLGRSVRRGSKALVLCMPVTVQRKERAEREDGTEEQVSARTIFMYKPHWFVLAQTEGKEYEPPAIPDWDEARALENLQIQRIPFEHLDGNVQGYAARGRKLAINPVAALPAKTFFHECAHLTLGHIQEADLSDTETLPRNLQEVEAEAVALLCCEALFGARPDGRASGLPGVEFCRGYIQSWIKEGCCAQPIGDRSAQRIFHAADQILKAGQITRSATAEAA